MWSVNVTDSLTGPDGRATAMTFQASVLLHTHWRMKLAAAYLNCLQIQIWAVPLALEKPQQPEQRNDQPTVTKYAQVHHKNRIFDSDMCTIPPLLPMNGRTEKHSRLWNVWKKRQISSTLHFLNKWMAFQLESISMCIDSEAVRNVIHGNMQTWLIWAAS